MENNAVGNGGREEILNLIGGLVADVVVDENMDKDLKMGITAIVFPFARWLESPENSSYRGSFYYEEYEDAENAAKVMERSVPEIEVSIFDVEAIMEKRDRWEEFCETVGSIVDGDGIGLIFFRNGESMFEDDRSDFPIKKARRTALKYFIFTGILKCMGSRIDASKNVFHVIAGEPPESGTDVLYASKTYIPL